MPLCSWSGCVLVLASVAAVRRPGPAELVVAGQGPGLYRVQPGGARAGAEVGQAVFGVLGGVGVAVVPDRGQRLGAARPADQRVVVDDRSVGPGRPGQILGGVLAAQVQARVGH